MRYLGMRTLTKYLAGRPPRSGRRDLQALLERVPQARHRAGGRHPRRRRPRARRAVAPSSAFQTDDAGAPNDERRGSARSSTPAPARSTPARRRCSATSSARWCSACRRSRRPTAAPGPSRRGRRPSWRWRGGPARAWARSCSPCCVAPRCGSSPLARSCCSSARVVAAASVPAAARPPVPPVPGQTPYGDPDHALEPADVVQYLTGAGRCGACREKAPPAQRARAASPERQGNHAGPTTGGSVGSGTMRSALVLNATYEPLSIVSVRRAVVLVLSEKADLAPRRRHRAARRSAHRAVPLVIRLRYFVRVPYHRRTAISRRAVFARDGHRCQYCGDQAESIDHVVPRSRGGEHVWENVVAACRPCNLRKRDRSPEEAGHAPAPPPGGAAGAGVGRGRRWDGCPRCGSRTWPRRRDARRGAPPVTWTVERASGSAGDFHGRELPDPLDAGGVGVRRDRRPRSSSGPPNDRTVVRARRRHRGRPPAQRRRHRPARARRDRCGSTSLLPRGDPLWDDDVGRASHWLGDVWVEALASVRRDRHRGPPRRSRLHAVVLAGVLRRPRAGGGHARRREARRHQPAPDPRRRPVPVRDPPTLGPGSRRGPPRPILARTRPSCRTWCGAWTSPSPTWRPRSSAPSNRSRRTPTYHRTAGGV